MGTAVILRVRRAKGASPLVWYEFAPIVDGKPQRRPDHMMASPETAALRARQHGFEPAEGVLDYDIERGRIIAQ
ncbi:MAG TPA: hypothetical protein VIG84_00585 [Brevundimonas sp.]